MAFSNVVQYGQLPFQFVNGFGIQNDLFTPDTVLNVFYGSTLDSNTSYELTLNPSILFIDSSIVGIGGVDKGPLLPNKVYGVYVAWDPVGNNSAGAFLSLSYFHPVVPYGYDAVRLVGYVATDSSANFILAKWSQQGNSAYRSLIYTPIITVLENGTANTKTDLNLISYIPNYNAEIVNFQLSFTSLTAGNSLTIYSDMGEFNLYAQAANIPNTSATSLFITKQILLGGIVSPIISYSVTNSSTDLASIYINGYDYIL